MTTKMPSQRRSRLSESTRNTSRDAERAGDRELVHVAPGGTAHREPAQQHRRGRAGSCRATCTDIAMLPARRPGSSAPSSGPPRRDGDLRGDRDRAGRGLLARPPAAGARSRPLRGRQRRSERDHRHRVRRHRAVHQVVAVRRQRDVDVHCAAPPTSGASSSASDPWPARCDVSASTSSATVRVLGPREARDLDNGSPLVAARHPHPDPAAAHQQRERSPVIATTRGEQRQLLAGVARDRERRPLDVAVEGRRCRGPSGSVQVSPGRSASMPRRCHVGGVELVDRLRAALVEAEVARTRRQEHARGRRPRGRSSAARGPRRPRRSAGRSPAGRAAGSASGTLTTPVEVKLPSCGRNRHRVAEDDLAVAVPHRDGRRVAVAEQEDLDAVDLERLVDLEPLAAPASAPGLAHDRDVGVELARGAVLLAAALVVRGEVVERERERRHRRRRRTPAGVEGVVLRAGVGEATTPSRTITVPRKPNERAERRPRRAARAARGGRPGCRSRAGSPSRRRPCPCRRRRTPRCRPASAAARSHCRGVVEHRLRVVRRRVRRAVLGQAARGCAARPAGASARSRQCCSDARQHAADQRDEQQQVDRREPRRGVDVEEAEPVEKRPSVGLSAMNCVTFTGVDAALREERAGHRASASRNSRISAVRMLVSVRQAQRSQPTHADADAPRSRGAVGPRRRSHEVSTPSGRRRAARRRARRSQEHPEAAGPLRSPIVRSSHSPVTSRTPRRRASRRRAA